MYSTRVLITIFFMTFLVSRTDCVDVECNTNGYIVVICKLTGITAATSVTRIKAEDPSMNCLEGINYSYEYLQHYYRQNQGWIYAFYRCGGTFRLTEESTPTWRSWGSWGACSVSCGAGIKSRTRTCSTGIISDCTTGNGESNMELKNCNPGSCDKTTVKGTIAAVCSKQDVAYRILGGKKAKECEYPWMVMYYNKGASTFCGGTIIDKNHILTAAHCLKSEFYTAVSYDIVVVSGANLKPSLYQATYQTNFNRQHPYMRFRYVSNIKIHQGFVPQYLTNDIAVMTLTEPITFDHCHVPVCVPSVYPSNLSSCKVMGWGATSNGYYARITQNLLYTEVNVLNPSTCTNTFTSWYFNTQRQICVGGNGKGSCKGDSGGPLVCPGSDGRYYQYGIVSGGAKNRCGILPSFYTKVTNYEAWIKANTDLRLEG